MRREFYFQDDKSNKFWTIEVRGATLVTSNGRMGAKARERQIELADVAEAEAAASKEIAAKLKKGYQEGSLSQVPAFQSPDWASMEMNDDVFWRIISLFNWKRTGDDDAVLAPAAKALSRMPRQQIEAFEGLLREKLYTLDTERHAREIGDDAYSDDPKKYFSADVFLYARCCVVANGRAFYEAVLGDPVRFPENMEFEAILYLSAQALGLASGGEQKIDEGALQGRVSYETFSNKSGWPQSGSQP